MPISNSILFRKLDRSTKFIGMSVNFLCFAMLVTGAIKGAQPAAAQESMTKPVLSAAPTPPPPPATAVPAPGHTSPADVSASYVIGPEDSIQVTVWKEPGLSTTLPVRPDGMISLPLLGDLLASGSTPMQLGSEISLRLKKYITDPNVTVSVLGVNSKRIFLIGEVGHTGALPLVPGMTLLQAISTAGGLTPYANAKHIYILRGEPGKQQKIPFDYKKAVKNGNSQGVSLIAGDTIVVP